MNRRPLVTRLMLANLLSMSAPWILTCSAAEATVAPRAAGSIVGADDVSLPAGVSARWWAQAQAAIRHVPNLDHAAATRSRARGNWKVESDQEGAEFGWVVGTAGDVNGDGYDDVIVGAPYYDDGDVDEGRAFVFHGSPSGLSTSPDWVAQINQAGAHFGFSVGTAGDVNGDGYDDVIVGAPDYESRQLELDEGGAFAYYGSASGLSTKPRWAAEGDQGGAHFGGSVGTAGDINSDGYSDVIVGAYYYTHGHFLEGAAFEYDGSASGLSSRPDWRGESNYRRSEFGIAVGTAGDVNGDGYDDVIVGAIFYSDEPGLMEGWVFVYYGSASGLSPSAKWVADDGIQPYSYFGMSVGTAGDVNGDGYDDVIVGAPGYDNHPFTEGEGRAFVYYGSAQGLPRLPDWTAETSQIAAVGTSVGTAGDVNGDGYDDVIVGAPRYVNGQLDEGRAFVYYGSPSGLSRTAHCTVESNQEFASLGQSVGTAGDVDGDGYDDGIVGAPLFDHGQVDEGGVLVFHGRPSGQ